MKHKKILIAIYIIIVITMATAGINKIFAASFTRNIATISRESNNSEDGSWKVDTVTSEPFRGGEIEELPDTLTRDEQSKLNNDVDYEHLAGNYYWFCIQHGKALPVKAYERQVFVCGLNPTALFQRFYTYMEKFEYNGKTYYYDTDDSGSNDEFYHALEKKAEGMASEKYNYFDHRYILAQREKLNNTRGYGYLPVKDSIDANNPEVDETEIDEFSGDGLRETYPFGYVADYTVSIPEPAQKDNDGVIHKDGYGTTATYRQNIDNYIKSNSDLLYLSRRLIFNRAKWTEKTTQDDKVGTVDYDRSTNESINIEWDEAYILACAIADGRNGTDSNGEYYDTIYQKVLWNIIKKYEDKRNIINGKKWPDGNWNVGDSEDAPETILSGDSQKLYDEAQAFNQYKNEQTNTNVTPKLNENRTSYEVTKENDYFLVGPINIDYGKLSYTYNGTSLEVRQISGLELKGKYSGGTDLEEITTFYFSNANGTQQTQVIWSNGKITNFPTTGTNFYIKVPKDQGNNKTLASVDSLKATFKALDVTAKIYEVTGLIIQYYEWEDNSRIPTDDLMCTKDWGWDSTAQSVWLAKMAELFWKKYELEITFKQVPQVIDIGGQVWVDMPPINDKEAEMDSIYTTDNDSSRQNVKVTLYFAANGQKVKEGTYYVGEEKVVIEHDDRNHLEGDVYTTYTNTRGEYSFYGLPAGYKYYVEFEYDGSEYEIVDYLKGGRESSYLSNPNSSEYNINSKVKDEIDRRRLHI